jgi:predicted N-acetyltransferase YhbS
MLLARLAIATSWQGKGLGVGLLKDAMQRNASGRRYRSKTTRRGAGVL